MNTKLFFCLLLLLNKLDAAPRRGARRRVNKNFSKMPGTLILNAESTQYYNNPRGARIISASHFESEYVLGRKIVFLCDAKGDPRPYITWFKDGIELQSHNFFRTREWKSDTDFIRSKMEIDPATQMDAGLYECVAENKYAIDRRAFRTDYAIDFD